MYRFLLVKGHRYFDPVTDEEVNVWDGPIQAGQPLGAPAKANGRIVVVTAQNERPQGLEEAKLLGMLESL